MCRNKVPLTLFFLFLVQTTLFKNDNSKQFNTHSDFSMKLIPVVCVVPNSQLRTYIVGQGYRQLTVLNEYGNKYELKAAANESKTKPNVGKGIASPSLVPGAEGRGKGVSSVYCLHVCVNP